MHAHEKVANKRLASCSLLIKDKLSILFGPLVAKLNHIF